MQISVGVLTEADDGETPTTVLLWRQRATAFRETAALIPFTRMASSYLCEDLSNLFFLVKVIRLSLGFELLDT